MALFGACLALSAVTAGSAMAQPAGGPRVIQVPPGAVVLILGAPGAVPAVSPVVSPAAPDAFPVMRLIAEQQAIVRRMVADRNALLPPMPDPTQLIQAAMGARGCPAKACVGKV
jgi:hypothetical protein